MNSLSPRIDNIDKNYIQNGGMDLFQRGLSALLSTSNSYYTADRFKQYESGAWTVAPTSSRSSSIPNKLSKYSLAHVGTATDGTATSTVWQPMESIVVQELSNETVSFGMWVSSDTNGPNSVTLTIEVPTVLDNFTSTTVLTTQVTPIVRAGGWQFVSIPNYNLVDVSNGMAVRAVFTNWVFGSSGTLLTTQWCMNQGPQSGNFVRHGVNYHGEIAACQRYFEKSYEIDHAPGTIETNGATQWFSQTSLTNSLITFSFLNRKRVTPTMVYYSPSTGSPGFAFNNSAGDVAASDATVGQSRASMATAGGGAASLTNYVGHFTADADLN